MDNFPYTVNQLLFAKNLFRNVSEMKWFATANFHEQVISPHIFKLQLHVYGKYWSVAKNIRDSEAIAKLAKIFRNQITVK